MFMSPAFHPKVFGLALLLASGAVACSADEGGGPHNQNTGGASSGAGAGNGGGTNMPQDLSKGGPKLRVLTTSEYRNAITDLLGNISAELKLPPDTFVGGFTAIGGAEVTIN